MDKVIRLNEYFTPRDYQIPIINALERDNIKKLLIIIARRAGKDVVAWNLLIRQAIKEPGLYLYCLPKTCQSRNVIWDGITKEGRRFLDYIPQELIVSKNNVEMKIMLKNNSIIKLTGSDNYDRSIVGSAAKMIVFSEWALCDPRAYQYARPIFAENQGKVLFLTTPRGHNHLHTMYNKVKDLPDWYTTLMTVDDTKHISKEEIQQLIDNGEMSWDLVQQEFYCSFSLGQEGAYFAKYIDKMYLNDQITEVKHRPDYPVFTVWDLGLDDRCTIVFYQIINDRINVIDCYNNLKGGLIDYIRYVKKLEDEREWYYDKHFAPHDMSSREIATGLERYKVAKQHGINFHILPKLPVLDGIEQVRCILPRTYIDETRCADLLKSLNNYHKEYDEIRGIYQDKPFKDWSNHFADSMRYLAMSLKFMRKKTTVEDIHRIRDEGMRLRHAPQFGFHDKLNDRIPQKKTIIYT